jgi:hypothetical protein
MKIKFWSSLCLAALALTAGWFSFQPVPSKAGVSEIESKEAASKERQKLLEITGTLAASHYYQTYLNIGFIADGKAEGIYGDKEANKVLDSVLALLMTADKQLEQVAKLDLEKEDRQSLEQMRKISAVLHQQGKELQAYWTTGDQERSAKYESLRKAAWTSISKLLGVEK